MSTPELPDAPIADPSLSDLLNQYAVMRAAKDEAERALDEIDEKLAPIKKAVIDAMIAAEFQRVSHNGRLYYLSVPGRPSIVPEKRPDFIQWLRENGEDGIITPDYINANTLWGWWNRLDEDVKPVVEPMLKISEEIELKSPADNGRKRKKR